LALGGGGWLPSHVSHCALGKEPWFPFAIEYAIRRVQENQDGLKLNGTHQLLAYADDVNILGGSIHILKENADALVAATRGIGLEVLIKLSVWSCLEIRMEDEFRV